MPVIVSQANKALLVPPEPAVLSLYGDRPRLPEGGVLVPHGMRETLMLRHLGFKVPNPIMMYYDWKGGQPFAIQKATVKMLTENPRAYVFNDMGTGKTRTALWAWHSMFTAGLVGRLLVVAPLSTLKFVWQSECFGTLPGIKVEVLHGSRQNRLDALAREADIYLINHDGVRVIADELYTRPDITCLVLDELAVYRNNSDRSKLMRRFAQKFATVWGMTGAPMPNEPTDVWAQAKIVTPNTVSKYRNATRDMLMVQVANHIWRPRADAIENAFKMVRPAVRFALEDVVELPDTISRVLDVDMTQEQQKVYTKVAKEFVAMVKNKKITALNSGAAMNKLLQIAGGWVYTQAPEYVRLDAAPRVATLIDTINSAKEKVIVLVPFRHMIEGLSTIFGMDKLKVDHCLIHGDTRDKETSFNLFQNTDKYKALLADPRCVYHGLTLTSADTIIWYLPITSLDVYDQANRRIRRVGQRHKQQILHLQSTPVERHIYTLLRAHQQSQDKLLDMLENATGDA
jgi:SNF2 family DNA or RNA helicase